MGILGFYICSFLTLAAIFNLVKCQAEPSFLEEPVDSEVIAGSTIFLRCQVENAAGSVQWTRDGFALGADRELAPWPRYEIKGNEALGEYHLLIANSQLEDDAVFQCQIGATATTRGKASAKATLTVLLPPGQPVIEGAGREGDDRLSRYHLNATEGVAYNITCRANHGKPAAQITWLIDGEEQQDHVFYEKVSQTGQKTEDAIGKLQITPSKGDNDKRVECRATNRALQRPLSIAATLHIQYRPEITLDVEPSRKVKTGDSVTFTCKGQANPNQITWKWQVAGEEVSGATQHVYVMSNIKKERNGQSVTCEASNSIGSSTQTHTLNVEFKPYFVSEPAFVAAEVGDDVTLQCDVSGNPLPSVTWRRTGTTQVVSRSESYSITAVQKRHFGVYTCTASSVNFPDASRNVHLLQKGAPKITSERKQSARVGEDAALTCETISVPAPQQITWSRDGKPLDIEELKRYSVREEETPYGRRSILEIQSSQEKDFGDYNCTVVNSYGPATAFIQFSQEVVSLTYILLGVLLSVAVIVVILITVYVLYRRRNSRSEYGSDSSENTLQKKEDKPEISQISSTQNGGPVDGWANSTVKYMNEQKRALPYSYTTSAYEDYPPKQPYGYDYQDGYGNRGYAPYPSNPYGTFPGPATNYTPRYAASDYGAPSAFSETGTYGRSRTQQPHYAASDYGGGGSLRPPHTRPQYAHSDYAGATLPRTHAVRPGPRAHAPASLDSRLATNV